MENLTHIEKLKLANLTIVGDYIGAGKKYHYTCSVCNQTHPGPNIVSKLSSFAKYGTNGCPTCKTNKKNNKYSVLVEDIKKTGLEVLQEYPNSTKIQVYRKECGHTHDIELGKYSRGGSQTCPICNVSTLNSERLTITELTETYIDKMAAVKIKLISPFTNRNDNHEFECLTCGTQFSGVFDFKLRIQNPCPECLRAYLSNQKIDNAYADKLLGMNIKLLEPYKGAKHHHLMECMECSHQWTATPVSKTTANKKNENWGKCPKCAAIQMQKTFDISRQNNIDNLSLRGFEILGGDISGRRLINEKIHVRNTNCGHTFFSSASNLYNGLVDCPVCNLPKKIKRCQENSKLKSIEYAKTASAWELYKSQVSIGTRKTLQTHYSAINPNNHYIGLAGVDGAYQIDHIVSVKWCFRNNVPVDLCSHPSNLQTLPWRENLSKKDKLPAVIPSILSHYITSNTIYNGFINAMTGLDIDAIVFDIHTLPSYELTIYFPSYKVGIMLCMFDEYLQQEIGDKYVHTHINERARDLGIRIYHIYQDEWCLTPSLILNKIKHILGVSKSIPRIHGRKCSISLITTQMKTNFLNQYHIQGTCLSVVNLGAFYNDELIAVMTFARPRIHMSQKQTINMDTYELSRFATIDTYRIPGIASKLLTYFEINYDYDYVYSYADRRWSDGGVYYKLGFSLAHYTAPSYYYIIDNKRMYRWGFRKDILKDKLATYDETLTEYQNMLNEGHDRVWDAGKIKFIKYKPQ